MSFVVTGLSNKTLGFKVALHNLHLSVISLDVKKSKKVTESLCTSMPNCMSNIDIDTEDIDTDIDISLLYLISEN